MSQENVEIVKRSSTHTTGASSTPGRGSGVPVAGTEALICQLRGGKIPRIRSYLDHDEALRADGLSE
jgi:ketosteroid isomerase-like protein